MAMIKEFLDRNGYQLNINDVNIELNSHPDYPSFKAYTDTLNNLEIENLAVTIPKDQFKKITNPVLVSLNSNGKADIALAQLTDNDEIKLNLGDKEAKQIILPYQKFLSVWDGSLIAIEKNTKKIKFKATIEVKLLTTLLLGAIIVALGRSFDLVNFFFELLTIIGLVVSYYIKKATIDPKSIPSKFCSIGPITDCNAVINSAATKIFRQFTLSDLVVIYFSTLYLSLLAGLQGTTLAWICTLSLGGVVYSLYQQAVTLKKWCTLCLAISLLLISHFFLSISRLNFDITVYETAMLTFLFALVTVSWFALKPFFESKQVLASIQQELKSFKRNYHLFIPFYKSSPEINIRLEQPDILLGGGNNTSLKILAITNPLCKTCFEVHKMLERLLEKHPNDLQISLRFYVPFHDPDDPRLLLAAGMIKSFQQNSVTDFRDLMKEWFDKRNVKEWLKKVNLVEAEDEQLEIIKAHKEWCDENNINLTPTILINNKKFPLFYSSTDLEHMIEGLIELEKQNKTEEMRNLQMV
uniref:vitamin K epoxide reductase family protein n=2 Tax=Roseivirga sp. TaxID=1964215 RepID=UPI00404871FE